MMKMRIARKIVKAFDSLSVYRKAVRGKPRRYRLCTIFAARKGLFLAAVTR
jgi:hypothetical protein